MSKIIPKIWPQELHTKAKHLILKAYLQSWLAIVGQRFQKIVYVDGFCGPGIYENNEPGSPILAINTIKEVLNKLGSARNLKSEKIELYFFDTDGDRIESLRGEISKTSIDGSRIKVVIEQGEFEERVLPIVKGLQAERALYGTISPSLFFVDPFGVKGFSLSLIGEIFRLNSSEIFLLFDVDGIDRILRAWDEANSHIMLAIYGDSSREELLKIKDLPDQNQRLKMLRDLFWVALRNQRVGGIIPFGMFDYSQKILYDLIFLTNVRTGFSKMKEAMWKVDDSGEFKFSDAEHGEQLRFKFTVNHEDNLWGILMAKFHGQKVSGLAIKNFVCDKTIYLDKHKTAALKKHESSDISKKDSIIVSNRIRNYGYPDQALIQFP
ncbi:MAG: three-Cys-motif partner protein TcmP [Candidatus Omnitrophica bacterium]|nr:three-Cys-motif partner protein TcmP [Candidatus Omnitrophota bacterium]